MSSPDRAWSVDEKPSSSNGRSSPVQIDDSGTADKSTPRYLLWFAASFFLALAGGWGLIGGWYFGLPGGGEIRQDVFGDLTLRDLFVAIPHPDFAEIPFVPKQGTSGFEVREKFRSVIGWKEGVLDIPSPRPPRQAPAFLNEQVLSKELTSRKGDGFAAQAPIPSRPLPDPAQVQAPPLRLPPAAQSAPPPRPPTDPVPFFNTNLASVQTVVRLREVTPTGGSCIVSTLGGGDSLCIVFPDLALNTPATYAVEQLAKAASPPNHLPLRLLGAIFPDQSGPISGLLLADFVDNAIVPSSVVTAATLGIDGGPTATGRPAIWVGSLLGNIFKITTDPAGITVRRLQVPFAAAISFVAFISPERGWIWTPSAGEHGILLPAAAQTFDGGVTWQRLSYRWLPAPWVFIAFILGAIAFERGTTAQLKLKPVVTEQYIADHGVSDDPIGLKDEDALGLRPISRSMARFLRNTETKPTVTIAVTGPWGSGKTSLMNLVKEELNERDVRTVWFNAWHNQKEENLLAALLASIRSQAVPPLWTVSGFIYRLRVAWMRMGTDPNATIALAVFAIVAFVIVTRHLDAAARFLGDLADRIGLLMPKPDNAQTTAGSAAPAASAITSIGLSTGGITALIYAGKKLWDLFKPLKSIPAELLSTLSGRPGTKEIDQQLSFRYRFASEFSIFCDTLRRPPHPGLVIFVDDLDRCAPKQTVDILEAINFVTSAGRCFVVLGLDENKVKAAIADSYKDTTLRLDGTGPSNTSEQTPIDLQRQKLADLNEFASRYLEKLIHLVIPIPRSRQETVEALLGLMPPSSKALEAPRWRTVAKTIVEMIGTILVVGFLISSAWLGLELATRSLPTVAASSAASAESKSGTDAHNQNANAADAGTADVVTTLRQTQTTSPPTAAQLSDAGLTVRGVLGTVPPPAVVLAFALLLIIMSFQFLPRLQVEPVVSDGPEFKEALRIWLKGIAKTHETPRAVKRFVNRLRFMAMRLRDLSAADKTKRPPLDEAGLVALAVIEDLNEDYLGEDDNELQARRTSGGDEGQDAAIILAALNEFRKEFGRDPYTDELALPTFRLLAGLVVEGRGDSETRARKKT